MMNTTLCWHFVDTDGQPTRPDSYLAAYPLEYEDDMPFVCMERWSGTRWVWYDEKNRPHTQKGVFAWAEMPDAPVRASPRPQ